MERAEKPYPYARPKTFEFLKEAVAEGAHLKIPKRLSRYQDAEEVWVKQRNIAGIYFTSPATIYDLGETYGYVSGARPAQIINRFIKYLWLNSSIDIRAKYRLPEIKIQKPYTQRTMFKQSASRGGNLQEIFELNARGKTTQEISELLELSTDKVKRALNKLGRRA